MRYRLECGATHVAIMLFAVEVVEAFAHDARPTPLPNFSSFDILEGSRQDAIKLGLDELDVHHVGNQPTCREAVPLITQAERQVLHLERIQIELHPLLALGQHRDGRQGEVKPQVLVVLREVRDRAGRELGVLQVEEDVQRCVVVVLKGEDARDANEERRHEQKKGQRRENAASTGL